MYAEDAENTDVPDGLEQELAGLIRELSGPLQPIKTGLEPYLAELREDVHAVIFDVYGTLFVSASGDVGTARGAARRDILEIALKRSGIKLARADAPARGLELFFSFIEEDHVRKRHNGVDYPEVDVRRIWTQVLHLLAEEGYLEGTVREEDMLRLAVQYECRSNPVWPMPGSEELIGRLKSAGKMLGIVSNAQFFTPLLFRAFFGESAVDLGFDSRLCIWSYEHGRAKPSTWLHEKAASRLKSINSIRPDKVIYVGNDMINDIQTARAVGFRTALFAGDRRSLRCGGGPAGTSEADIIITDLNQLTFLE